MDGERWIEMIQNDLWSLAERLHVARGLLVVGTAEADGVCVRLLDILPPNTLLGDRYRELVVTHGAVEDALCVLLWESSGWIRCAAADALSRTHATDSFHELLAVWAAEQAKPTVDVRFQISIIRAIEALLVRLSDVSLLMEMVLHRDDEIRLAAREVLCRRRPAAAVSILCHWLRVGNSVQRFESMELLPVIAPLGKWVSVFVGVLECDSDSLMRWMALDGLSRLPHPSAKVIAAIARATADPDATIQEDAHQALAAA